RFRLAEILNEFRDTGRGIIKKISDETGLERHQVSALLKNDVQYLSLNSLGAICDYLINIHHMNVYELPGRLFALEPEDFWAFLSEKQSLVMSFGVRQELQETSILWVPAADSFLQGTLLHELYGTEPPPSPETANPISSPPFDQGPRFDQYMVRSCSSQLNSSHSIRDGEFQQMKREATNAYEKFHSIAGNKVLICLGSVKSNGLCELVIAKGFSVDPWVSQDHTVSASQRPCPFFIRFREGDVNLPSCQGGKQFHLDNCGDQHLDNTPGLYFERNPGEWDVVPSDENREPALIFYSYHPPSGVVEIVMGGFSTEGTFLLAQHLRKIVPAIWPPEHITPSRETGVFVVDFQLKPQTNANDSPVTPSELQATIRDVEKLEVIRLPEAVLKHRISQTD
ncbi:MAG: helix-turn-helix transcriptional regulator, partial [Planctomycetaceae bacterium]|nr:helix-turn-helix transcriptional regulator [Planctomycetaceae bacterium]